MEKKENILKTLKDLFYDDCEEAKIIKKEAIKWVKVILETDKELFEEAISKNTRVSWIVHFFNITEEDLK